MDRDPSFAVHRQLGDPLQPAPSHTDRLPPRPRAFPGQDAARRALPSAVGAAAGGYRACPAAVFGRTGPLGAFLAEHFGIIFSFRWTGAALACAVMSFPLMMRAIRLQIEAIDRRLEAAAGTLGAGPIWTFFLVTLPLAIPGIVVGSILCFAKALGEFGATTTFVSNIPGETQTISALIYTYTQVPGGDVGALRRTIVLVRDRVLGAARLRDAAAAGPGADRRNSMIAVDVALQLGTFSLAAAFSNDAGITGLFGRSGSGKSTVINLIAGLARPDRGRILLDGRVLVDTEAGVWAPKHRRRIGLVFQDAQLFPHLSVRQNLLFGRWFAPRGKPRIGLDAVVETLGIGHLLKRRPELLSGGEKQRVALGRGLLASPRLLLMDGPLASLDIARKAEILPLIERLRDEFGIPIVYVSHAVEEVARLANKVMVLNAGRVVAVGSPSEVLGLLPGAVGTDRLRSPRSSMSPLPLTTACTV